ncbi:MAG: cyclic nucleotide-binding domain-containing protein [Thermoanaerobaculia bacterium]|nr:cyclic nucleotide-binding domain-containing protein [Thermoanaerobaculia bacterium]
MSIQDDLRHLTALSHFSLEQLEQLAEVTERLEAEDEQAIVRHGDESSQMYGLIRGALSIERETPNGTFVLARLKPGEVFGEANFIDPHVRSTDVVTTRRSDLLVFDSDGLRSLQQKDTKFDIALTWAIWKSISRKLRITTRMLGHFFAGNEAPADSSSSTVSEPKKRGEPFEVDIRAKRDLFLEQDLSHLEANFMASLSQEERFAAGETIFREGDPGEKLYFVLDGEVRISKELPGSGEEALAILGRGELFGEMSLVDGRPRTADALAHEAGADVLVIKAAVLSGILDFEKLSSARLLTVLCRTVARRLRTLDDKVVGWYMLSGGQSTLIGSSSD